MKVYTYFLRGSEVNHQWTMKPKYFVLKFMRYAWMLRVWRFQIVIAPR